MPTKSFPMPRSEAFTTRRVRQAWRAAVVVVAWPLRTCSHNSLAAAA